MSTIETRLEALAHTSRLAFAAGCAERVIAVYEFDGYREDAEPLQRAVEAVWKAACGLKVGPKAVAISRETVSDAIPSSDEDEPGYTATILSGVAVLNALDAILDPTVTSVVRVSFGDLDAFQQVAGDEGLESEQAFQSAALDLLEGLGGRPITRNLFASLPPPPVDLFEN